MERRWVYFGGAIIAAVTAILVGTFFALSTGERRQAVSVDQDRRSTSTQPIIPAPTQSPAKISFVGDIMLGRNVEGLMEKEGLDYPFLGMTSIFQAMDFAVANLEGPVLQKHARTPTGSTSFNFLPTVTGPIAKSGIDAVSLANNHTLDRGEAGYQETRQHLTEGGIGVFGHPQQANNDLSVLHQEVQGQPLTLIGLHDVFEVLNEKAALQAIQEVAAADKSFVIVFIHWGDEYKPIHNARQERLAQAFIDAGADAVIGHHPHVVQDVAVYKGKAIFYSLGNFIFDQYFSEETQQGLMVTLELNEKIATYHLTPIAIPKSQPVPMEREQAITWLEALAKRSDPALSDQIKEGTISP